MYGLCFSLTFKHSAITAHSSRSFKFNSAFQKFILWRLFDTFCEAIISKGQVFKCSVRQPRLSGMTHTKNFENFYWINWKSDVCIVHRANIDFFFLILSIKVSCVRGPQTLRTLALRPKRYATSVNFIQPFKNLFSKIGFPITSSKFSLEKFSSKPMLQKKLKNEPSLNFGMK